MIKKILSLRNVGLLQDACVNRKLELGHATGIFAENGRGKSTLATILRACHTGDTTTLGARRTFGTTSTQEINLLLQDGSCLQFDGATWTGKAPDMAVFDSEFIEQNVYSGVEVRSDQRQALLSFAIGDDVVPLKQKVEQLTQQIAEQTSRRTQAQQSLAGYIQPYSLADFIQLAPDPHAPEQLQVLHKRIEASKNAKHLSARHDASPVPLVKLDVQGCFDILSRQLDDVQDAAEAMVMQHLHAHAADGIEDWVSTGQTLLAGEDCPFCGQAIGGLPLIEAFRSYFNEHYQALKADVAKLRGEITSAVEPQKLDALIAAASTNAARVEAWHDQLQLSVPSLDVDDLGQRLERLREKLLTLITAKELQPLSSSGTHEDQEHVESLLRYVNEPITEYNTLVTAVVAQIDQFKTELQTEDATTLQAEVKRLEAVVRRYTSDVVQLVADYVAAEEERSALEAQKIVARKASDEMMANTLIEYRTRINELLIRLGAQFSVGPIKPNYAGSGDPRTDYYLQVRSHPVKLGSRDSVSVPSFGTVLSEADKRTLAFVFFVARLLKPGSDLGSKVVVLDDPVSSLDHARRRQTINVIRELASRCKQLVVLSHDAYFLRDLRDRLVAGNGDDTGFPIWELRRVKDDYSAFEKCDIDGLCASDYYRHHQMVSDFVGGSSTSNIRDVGKAIRPLLEGFYHRRFPGHVPKRTTFGRIIDLAADPAQAGPLSYLGPVIDELREVNEYAKMFHHDEGEEFTTSDGELLRYAEQALNLIYRS